MRSPRRRCITLALHVALLSLLAASPLLVAQARTLRLVSTDWPPFTGAAGQPRLALDLVEAALGRVRQPSTTTGCSFDPSRAGS